MSCLKLTNKLKFSIYLAGAQPSPGCAFAHHYTHQPVIDSPKRKRESIPTTSIFRCFFLLLVSGRVDSFKLKDEFFKILPTAWTQTHTQTAFGILYYRIFRLF